MVASLLLAGGNSTNSTSGTSGTDQDPAAQQTVSASDDEEDQSGEAEHPKAELPEAELPEVAIPEAEVPVAQTEDDGGKASGDTNEPKADAPEVGHNKDGNDVYIDENGDILLPEVPND